MKPDLSARARLSRRGEKILLALMENPNQEKAAAAAGISKVTLWRWQQKPKFQRALAEARREAYSQAVARLQQGSGAAAATLLRVMTDTTAPAASRVRAASCILATAARSLELQELEIRVRELESAGRQVTAITELKKAA